MKMYNFAKWANEGSFVTENCFNFFKFKIYSFYFGTFK